MRGVREPFPGTASGVAIDGPNNEYDLLSADPAIAVGNTRKSDKYNMERPRECREPGNVM